MFDEVKQALHDLLHGNVTPEGRRALLSMMRDTVAQARVGLDDLRASIATTQKRLRAEEAELATVRRRKTLAQGINDAETVVVAERFETQHAERVAVLTRKLEAQEGELALTEREVDEMTKQLKAAATGVGSGLSGSTAAAGATDPSGLSADLDDGRANLEREMAGLDRAQRRAAAEADAESRLAELKRRMGGGK